MGYLNPILSLRLRAPSPHDAAEAGVDGLIVVDCPPEEADPLADALDAAERRPDPPGDPDHRRRAPEDRRRAAPRASSTTSRSPGVTGGKEADAGAIAPAVARVRAASRPAGRGRLRHPHAGAGRRGGPGRRRARWWARPWWMRSPAPSHRTVIRSPKVLDTAARSGSGCPFGPSLMAAVALRIRPEARPWL